MTIGQTRNDSISSSVGSDSVIAKSDQATPAIRVLLVTHYFPAHRGGVEIVAQELARRLAPRFSIQWMAAACDPSPSLPGVTADGQPAWNGLERRTGLPWPIWTPASWRKLTAAISRADVIHIHDFIYPSSIAALWLAHLQARPVLITQHIGDIDYTNPLLRSAIRWINRSLGRSLLSRADQVVFISPKVKALFEAFTQFRSPPIYWPNGVDTSHFTAVSAVTRCALRKKLDARDDMPVVLFVGRFVEKKGLRLLRQLAIEKPGWQWWFAGWGDSGDLHPSSWQLPQVRVWEGYSGASLADIYRAADALVLPSYGEGYPLVVQESLACGTPVVLSEETAAGGPLSDDIIHAVPHQPRAPRPAAWLAALKAIIDAPATTREKVRAQAATFAAAEWNWDQIAECYAEQLAKLSIQHHPTR